MEEMKTTPLKQPTNKDLQSIESEVREIMKSLYEDEDEETPTIH